jgi:hypothetical protein
MMEGLQLVEAKNVKESILKFQVFSSSIHELAS